MSPRGLPLAGIEGKVRSSCRVVRMLGMANFTLTATQTFPETTVITVYPASNWAGSQVPPPGSAPLGASTTSGTLTAGSVTFSGLTAGVKYYATAVVNAVQVYVAIQPRVPVSLQQIPFGGRTGALTVSAGTAQMVFSAAVNVIGVTISAGTAPTGANLICDVNKNGTTIFTTQANRPTIVAGNNRSSEATPDVVAFASGDFLTVDVDQIGSGTAGSDLTVTVRTGT